jgi:molecular chaperone DnaJ
MRKTGFAMYVQVTPCPTCRGKGVLIESPCINCHGSGLVKKRRRITVKIPVGIDDGYQLRLRGEGEMAPHGDEPGDLYVQMHVLPNALFMREGDDLLHVLIISYPQAALGGDVSVPTLEGPTTLRIRPGTQAGEALRLKGKGMPHFRGYGKGDLLIRIGISVPEKLTSQQRALLEQLGRELGEEGRPKSHRFRI